MSHEYETGFMVNQPSWHRLERAVLPEYVTDWQTAVKESGITWEVETEPVYDVDDAGQSHAIPGWQKIVRDDKQLLNQRVLSIQPESYQVIKIAEFGEVIDACLGVDAKDDPVRFEALMSLYGGRKIIALTRFLEPIQASWDPSSTYTFCAFCCNFDGQGGLTGIPTNVRVQCANTWRFAEETDGKRVGFTIRHTRNWGDRVDDVARVMRAARKDAEAWRALGEKLSVYKAGPRQREVFLKRWLPRSDDMTDRMVLNVERARDKVRAILASDTCDGIAGTGYGLVMAAVEYADHARSAQSADSAIARQLLRKEDLKTRAFRVVKGMAKV